MEILILQIICGAMVLYGFYILLRNTVLWRNERAEVFYRGEKVAEIKGMKGKFVHDHIWTKEEFITKLEDICEGDWEVFTEKDTWIK